MTDAVRGDTNGATRAGAQTLALLSVPINVGVLKALAEGPRSLPDLRRAVDSPPQTTMRGYLRELTRTGVVERHRRNDFPGNVEYQLAAGGRELLAVAEVVDAWLRSFPEEPTVFGSGAAKSAIKALVDGWSTSMIRALAIRPLSLTELDAVIASVSYPSLERRLAAMRLCGLVEPLPSGGRGTPYAVSEWLRKAIAPIGAAARWERVHVGEETPTITNRDAEAAFMLALPLLSLPAGASGSCRLGVQVGNGDVLAGVVASVRDGKVEACATKLEREADAWAVGSADAWFATVIERDSSQLVLGGNDDLANEVVAALHKALFDAVA